MKQTETEMKRIKNFGKLTMYFPGTYLVRSRTYHLLLSFSETFIEFPSNVPGTFTEAAILWADM